MFGLLYFSGLLGGKFFWKAVLIRCIMGTVSWLENWKR